MEFCSATGRLFGLLFEYELGILNPWSVGDGVDTTDSLSEEEEADPSEELSLAAAPG